MSFFPIRLSIQNIGKFRRMKIFTVLIIPANELISLIVDRLSILIVCKENLHFFTLITQMRIVITFFSKELCLVVCICVISNGNSGNPLCHQHQTIPRNLNRISRIIDFIRAAYLPAFKNVFYLFSTLSFLRVISFPDIISKSTVGNTSTRKNLAAMKSFQFVFYSVSVRDFLCEANALQIRKILNRTAGVRPVSIVRHTLNTKAGIGCVFHILVSALYMKRFAEF